MSQQTQSETVEITMEDSGPDHSLFDEAIEAIQFMMSPRDQRDFQHHIDISSLLEDLRSISAENVKEQRRLITCSRKMTLFARTFASFFDIVSIFVQLRPDWLGWFWGTIRMVFKAGSRYILFLEKIADMFEAVAYTLPQYRQIYESCKQRFHGSNHDERLTALMSYVYADIVQFCLDLYRMFSRGSQGAKLRHFRLSSSAVLWRPLDSRFALLEERLLQHRRWFEFEARKEVQDYASIAQHRRDYIEFLHSQPEANGTVEEDRMARRLRRVDKVKAWLSNCCAYRDLYEFRARQRHPNSCSWFLSTEQYCKWKNTPFNQATANDLEELERNWHDRILFVQAPPGFGKTTISGAVIDDLSAEAEDLNISDDPPTTAFFHFNAAHSYCTHPNDAFRALAAQLVHAHRHDRSTLDALALLMRKTPSQGKASSDDVLAVLSLLLRQHSTFLVIDGIDECTDVELFLTVLPELCQRSDSRAVLFSRPNIEIPLVYQKWASDSPHVVSLDKGYNTADIVSYMSETLNRMADQGFFGISMDRTLIPQVAGRANGVFLWASLLLKYLQSPGLSPDERKAALEQAHELEGLEALYRNMLNLLDRSPAKEKQVAVDTFRWLSLSITRLCIPALQATLAIHPGQPTTEAHYLLNFSEALPRLTCSLVEVTDCSVVFTHRSIKEYLQSPECQHSHFSLVDETTVHAHLTARCLSYLANDVPKRPLGRLVPFIRPAGSIAVGSSMSTRTSRSGDSGYKSLSSASDTDHGNTPAPTPLNTAVAMPPFDDGMPFLRYASLCWPVHLTRALSHPTKRSVSPASSFPSTDAFGHTPWLPVLSHLLADRAAVAAWVEASWRYSLPPNLSRLVPLLTAIKAEIPPATIEGRELRWVVHGLRELSDALNELRGEYGTTLRENPSLIWQWNGRRRWIGNTEVGDMSFWPVWDERAGRVNEGV